MWLRSLGPGQLVMTGQGCDMIRKNYAIGWQPCTMVVVPTISIQSWSPEQGSLYRARSGHHSIANAQPPPANDLSYTQQGVLWRHMTRIVSDPMT